MPLMMASDQIESACDALCDRWMPNLAGEPIYGHEEGLAIQRAWLTVHEAASALHDYGRALDRIDPPVSHDLVSTRTQLAGAAERALAALEGKLAGLQAQLRRVHEDFQHPESLPPALHEIRDQVEPVIVLLRNAATAQPSPSGSILEFVGRCEASLVALLPGSNEVRRSTAAERRLRDIAPHLMG